MNSNKNLLIIGVGGHGRVVADIAERADTYEKIAFLDDMPPGADFSYPYLGRCDDAEKFVADYDVVIAIGNGAVRQRLMERLAKVEAQFATVIAPDAVIAADVIIGAGTVICPGVIINTGTKIGKGVIINTAASVDHGCVVEDYCHVAVGARICGTVYVGSQTWIGASATVINNISVCSECMIGAGTVVVRNIETSGTYFGVPARRRK